MLGGRDFRTVQDVGSYLPGKISLHLERTTFLNWGGGGSEKIRRKRTLIEGSV